MKLSTIELLILIEVSKDSACSFRKLSQRLGIKSDKTIRDCAAKLELKNYLIQRKGKRVRFLTLKGYEQIVNLDTSFTSRN